MGRRNFRNREEFEAFKANLMRQAIEARRTRGTAEHEATAASAEAVA